MQPATTGIISTHYASHFLFVWSDWDVMKELSTVTFQLMSEFEDNNADIRSMGCKHQLEHHYTNYQLSTGKARFVYHIPAQPNSPLSPLSQLFISRLAQGAGFILIILISYCCVMFCLVDTLRTADRTGRTQDTNLSDPLNCCCVSQSFRSRILFLLLIN